MPTVPGVAAGVGAPTVAVVAEEAVEQPMALEQVFHTSDKTLHHPQWDFRNSDKKQA